MREIKFRAWNKRDKVMEYDVNVNQGKPVKQGYQWFDTENIETVYHSSLQQYTGLKDCHGREIYEGDIVRCYGGACFNGIYEYNYVIEVRDIRDLNEIVHSENVEILGNRYENPELLEEKRTLSKRRFTE